MLRRISRHQKITIPGIGIRIPGLLASLAFTLVAAIGATGQAQNFDLEKYLNSKDVNRNGRVEPEELSSNAKGILKKMGFDDTKSNSIKKIVYKADKDRKVAADKSKPSSSRTRKVPGFGVESKAASEGVPRFGASSAGSSSRKSAVKFSDSVVERVKSTLDRYDKNKDGSLDKGEISKARWGSPPPEQNDTNRDGRLSFQELGNRYASREQYYASSRTTTSSKNERSSNRGTDDRAKERSRYRSTPTSSRSTPTSSRSSSTSSASNTRTDTTSQAKYEKYAESLVGQYDSDKDGKLSAEETKKMRRPPAGADADKDGFITKEELVGSLSGTNRSSTTSAKEKSASNDKSEARSSRDRSSSRNSSRSTSRGGSSSSFDKLDANLDRHVQMHEFSQKWDDRTVDEFYEKDRNGDGVITIREWSGDK